MDVQINYIEGLTTREHDVIKAMFRGLLDCKELAKALNITQNSLHNKLTAIYCKLGVSSKSELIFKLSNNMIK